MQKIPANKLPTSCTLSVHGGGLDKEERRDKDRCVASQIKIWRTDITSYGIKSQKCTRRHVKKEGRSTRSFWHINRYFSLLKVFTEIIQGNYPCIPEMWRMYDGIWLVVDGIYIIRREQSMLPLLKIWLSDPWLLEMVKGLLQVYKYQVGDKLSNLFPT